MQTIIWKGTDTHQPGKTFWNLRPKGAFEAMREAGNWPSSITLGELSKRIRIVPCVLEVLTPQDLVQFLNTHCTGATNAS